jgi:8-oxo-dGTP diphosphatase
MAPTPYNTVLARNIRAARNRLGLSQAEVVERMRSLGFTSWHKPTLGNVERGDRRVLGDETAGLAFALETTISRLMAPLEEDQAVEFGEGAPPVPVESVRLSAVGQIVHGALRWDGGRPVFTDYTSAVREVTSLMAAGKWPPGQETRPVVAAVVTSAKGVLIGRRNDGTPPWTFIAGEIEPGERPEDAAEREVKEETGAEIRAGEVIGERDHPATGRHMIYLAAKPARATRLIVGDEAELAEVRWASLAEADELLPGMFGPVREYLARELGNGGG